MSWRTTVLLKSSGPMYVPSVTRKPPSTPSSRILRSRSFSRATRSFSRLRASLSCLVSRRGSSVGRACSLLLEPRCKKDRFCLLLRPLRKLYTGLGASLLAVPEREREADGRWSLLELGEFPMVDHFSQARCGEARQMARIPRSKCFLLLGRFTHATLRAPRGRYS